MARQRSVDDLLRVYPPDVQALASGTRQLVKKVLPGISENADTSASLVGYGYAPGYRGMVATMILSRGGVKLGLAWGATLPDPRKLLEGTGKVHRYVAIREARDLKRPGISALLKGASRLCRERLKVAGAGRERL